MAGAGGGISIGLERAARRPGSPPHRRGAAARARAPADARHRAGRCASGAITSRAPSGSGSTATSRPSTATAPEPPLQHRRRDQRSAWNCAAAKPERQRDERKPAPRCRRRARHAQPRPSTAAASTAAPSQRGGSLREREIDARCRRPSAPGTTAASARARRRAGPRASAARRQPDRHFSRLTLRHPLGVVPLHGASLDRSAPWTQREAKAPRSWTRNRGR